MEQVTATRAELLQKKGQILLARQGRDLLKEKRNALMQELMRTASQAMKHGQELERQVGQAEASLAVAEALDGPEAVRSAGLAAQGRLSLAIRVVNLMGVAIPRFEQKSAARGPLDRGYSLPAVSERIEAAATAFEWLIDLAVRLAESELRLRRLAAEIGQTTRRVNALENVLIPRLEAERNAIQLVLEEREREDLFRLKRVKNKLAVTNSEF
jgi:V/A-type H+-transporting ATPase subunit D